MIVIRRLFMITLLLTSVRPLICQTDPGGINEKTEFYGFLRGGLYSDFDGEDGNKPYVSSAFSDLALKINTGNYLNFKAYGDLRFRYGVEFQEPSNSITLREGYVKAYGKMWDITAGQQIVKWGKGDFTNPVSRLNPRNYIYRSPEKEDMDMGNMIADLRFHPSEIVSFEATMVPFFRSSVLIIDPIPIPDYVKINEINSLITDKEMFSYGLKADFHLSSIDASVSWFEGYDPMPGTELTDFSIDFSSSIPVPATELTFKPYKTKLLGFDFESSLGDIGIRGEAAWSEPLLSYLEYEYVPLPEVAWVTGADYSTGNWRFLLEYSGKSVLDYTAPGADPVLGAEFDFVLISQMLSDPGFNPEDYVRQQIGAFNRLYNYQLERYYHSVGSRIEADFLYGKLTPSVFTMYNFISKDFILIPELRIKPSDRFSVIAGFEYYRGIDDSLYELVHDFMNNFYATIRIDF